MINLKHYVQLMADDMFEIATEIRREITANKDKKKHMMNQS